MSRSMLEISTTYENDIDEHGFAIVEDVITPTEVNALRIAIEQAITESQDSTSVRDRGGVYAIRNVTEVVPEVRALHKHPGIAQLVAPILGTNAMLVRGLMFDKSPESNWGIFWHQDLSIAVRQREDVAEFGPWSIKAGIQHVQPPPPILQQMLTVRLHLDDCMESNGALRVLPGSHRSSRLNMFESETLQQNTAPKTCCVHSGGAVMMRPLLLHSSHRATDPARRRVIHLEFAAEPLPEPLTWYTADRIAKFGEQ
ncbi:MAG: ectoine hydroxylase-related dioxygenase (phytanoyl-CoA dioxygenase family) [Planctomycetaceae bacterium]|jgi:ectoine hydroxylase-related dioxygenase (phytanoyl-CoA dioxygenase family)